MSLPAPIDAPGRTLSQLPYIAAQIDSAVEEWSADPTMLAWLRDVSTSLQSELKPLVERIDFLLLQQLGSERELPLANGVRVERYREMKEDYDDDKVRDAYASILSQHAVNGDGEIMFRPEDAPRIVEILVAVMGKAKPKKQALKAHRIDPRDLCELKWSDDKVRIVAPEVEEPKMSHPPVTIGDGGSK